MDELTINVAGRDDVDAVQSVLLHREIASHLGGMTFRDTIKGWVSKKDRGTAFLAKIGSEVVGACVIGGRPQSHLIKFGSIGVVPEHRRRRIASCLYWTMTAQAVVEGRRLCEDTIVGNNEIQHQLLPTLGLYRAGVLKKKTASALDLHIYQLDLLDVALPPLGKVCKPGLACLPPEVIDGPYAADLREKNQAIFDRQEERLGRSATEAMQASLAVVRASAITYQSHPSREGSLF